MGSLRIAWPKADELAGRTDAAAAKAAAKEACSALGQGLLAGRGSWDQGLFDNYACWFGEETGAAPFAGARSASSPAWLLQVVVEDGAMRLALDYTAATPPLRVATVALPKSEFSRDLLRDPRYAVKAAALLLDALPAAQRLTGVSPTAVEQRLALSPKSMARPPSLRPQQLTLFTWWYDQDARLWEGRVVGSARLAGRAGGLYWQLHFRSAPGNATVYAQEAAGPGLHRAEILRLLQDDESELLHDPTTPGYAKIRDGVEDAARFLVLNTIASGYVGLRLGREFVDPQSAVIPPGYMVGLIGELRGGIAAGLRGYYDVVPNHGTAAGGEPLHIGWSRAVIGYGFGLPLNWWITRLELAPKIGLWNVDTRLPDVNAQGDVVYEDFVLHNALSFGLDLAAEMERGSYLLRAWYSRDVSTPLTKVDGIKRNVLSVRYGFDALLKGTPVQLWQHDWRISYLLFGYYEDMAFTQSSDHSEHFTLNFNTAYVGGGLSLAW